MRQVAESVPDGAGSRGVGMMPPPNRVTLAPGHDPATISIWVNGEPSCIAALLDMDAAATNSVQIIYCPALLMLDLPTVTSVDVIHCIALATLNAPTATRVNVSGCMSLTALDLPTAIRVYAYGCIALTTVQLPVATWIDLGGVDRSPQVIQGWSDDCNYGFVGLRQPTEWRVFADCHNMTFAEALAYWNLPDAAPDCLELVQGIIEEAARRDAAAALTVPA